MVNTFLNFGANNKKRHACFTTSLTSKSRLSRIQVRVPDTFENLNLREWKSSFPQNGITFFFFRVPILLASNLHLSKPKQMDDIPGFQAVIRVHGNLIVVYILQLF